jgi:NTE family protein
MTGFLRWRCALGAALVGATFLAAAAAAQAADRPRVGLVLGGGGARGAAHIGVLEVLDRLRVPVDCVAGTSMGALVAGAWGAGLTPAEMRTEMAKADWVDMFLDNPDYTEINFRNKRLAQRFLPGSELGLDERGFNAPAGVVTGQKIKLFFNQLVRADLGERDIANLPLPVSIIATDIGTGERVVFREGSLTMAMRASMSVPGLMAPVELQGRKLVDGGLVDNVPIREVRERCKADVVIAVNVGSPLLKPQEVSGLLSVSAQMVNILTEQNVSQSLASLKPGDIYIRPDLEGIGAGDFPRHAETADRGRAAAETQAAALAALAVPEAQYAQWRAVLEGRDRPVQRVDEVQITGLQVVNPQTVSRHLQQQPGELLDTERLNRDLLRAFGDGYYQSVDYSLLTQRQRNVLQVTPIEKPWGPDYVRMAINLDSNLLLGSAFSLRLAYQRTWMNALGGEFLATAQIGSNQGLGVEWYQPLDARQRTFLQATAGAGRERADIFLADDRVSEYLVGTLGAELSGGINLGQIGQARLGWRATRRTAKIDIGAGVSEKFDDASVDDDGLVVAIEFDQLNQLHFPSRGWDARLQYFGSGNLGYGRLEMDLRGAFPLGQYVMSSRFAQTLSTHGRLPYHDAARLGGLLNLSAFADGQLTGDSATYLQLRAERIIGRLPPGLNGDLRVGLALEAGRLGGAYDPFQRRGWIDSTALYLGGLTPIGPLYLGVGHSSTGSTNAYLFIGTP